jgi:hypothetical protein
MASASGPAPFPPSDLHARSLSLAVVDGQPLWRIHRTVHDPFFFGPPAGFLPTGRWDAPAGQFGVCYLAADPRIAFAETLLRDGVTLVGEKRLAERSLARFEVVEPLRLAMLHGPGLLRIGATAAVSSGPHDFSREWSLALYDHPDQPDGILYRTRHDDDGFGVALFDRSSHRIRHESSRALLDPFLAVEVGRWLDTYAAGLV